MWIIRQLDHEACLRENPVSAAGLAVRRADGRCVTSKGVPCAQGVHNQWPNAAANRRAHANEVALNSLDLPYESVLCRLTGFLRHTPEETADPSPTSNSQTTFLRSSSVQNNPARTRSPQEYLDLKTGGSSWFTLCSFYFLWGGGKKVTIAMSCGDAADQSRRFSVLSWDQVRRLDSILGEAVPIHGRGNFPTLSVQPRQIVQVIRHISSLQISAWESLKWHMYVSKCV